MSLPHDDIHSGADLHAECYACPVGSLFAGLQTVAGSAPATSPAMADTIDRFWSVAQEFLDLGRTAIDVAEATVAEQRAARAARASDRPRRVRRIDIA